MGENSEIGWTDDTFNPWMGCVKVSAGCKFCYAETLVTGRMRLPLWGLLSPRRVTAKSTWTEPRRWNRKAEKAGVRRRVFCASLADVFEDRPDLAGPRRRLFRLIAETPHLDWMLLTKRPEAMARLAREAGWPGDWPSNVWAGCTVEDQEQANARIPHLLLVPARVRFLSCEPLLEQVTLFDVCEGALRGPAVIESGGMTPSTQHEPPEGYDDSYPGIDWVIVGGESGPHARIFDLAWARSIRDQCKAAGVPFFFKQAGSLALDGDWSGLSPLHLRHPKGADLDELSEDLRVQEFPDAGRAALP